ncbi:AraC family transcriptional regulator [Alcanivorax sp. 1008]|uniref:AraC family transcriptional regulator n=1 Tax=Alcanivorax sp. 1008 TaxID=2816853 RepID=UPI001E006644|nr:AraC family transcriptional regulator [Alcanivorax sp. 1008]MCC1497844.1 helix-turn-helix domain-containing protein [Alcanivorax sp. 1008]
MPIIKVDTLSFPVSYVQVAEEICAARGLDADRFLADQFGITAQLRADPQGQISGTQFSALMGLLLEFASQSPDHQRKLIDFFPPTIHGYVALAAITSATVKNALDIAVRYAHQVMPAFEMSYTVNKGQCQVSLNRLADLGDGNALLTEMVFCALHSFLRLFGGDTTVLHLTLIHDKLVLSELPRLYPNLTVEMGRDSNMVRFPESHLNAIIATRNTATHQAIEQALEKNEARLRQRHSMTHRVSGVILSMLQHQRVVEAQQVAQALALSSRTLNRRLAEEGTNLRQLYNDCRCSIAQQLLHHGNMTVSQISQQLGFSDEANFSRFFKQQTGQSPGAFRASGKQQEVK